MRTNNSAVAKFYFFIYYFFLYFFYFTLHFFIFRLKLFSFYILKKATESCSTNYLTSRWKKTKSKSEHYSWSSREMNVKNYVTRWWPFTANKGKKFKYKHRTFVAAAVCQFFFLFLGLSYCKIYYYLAIYHIDTAPGPPCW